MPTLSGSTIKGYLLQDPIGEGGFGTVYRAYQAVVGREVAIKIILPERANNPEFIRRFEAEAQTIARLEHMHIAPLYDFWRDPDGAYLVMRYFRGGSLKDALKNGPFGLRATSTVIDQIAAALTVAHRQDIIHRDLKPGNILLDEDSNAYLADFGIAKDIGTATKNLTDVDSIVGSLDYISPEQARRAPVTPRTDIYSLGVVLYEMLKGEHPFPGITPIERLYRHLNDQLPHLDNLGSETQDAINAVIQKATAKDPAKRFADALSLAMALRQAAQIGETSEIENVVEQLTRREQEILLRIIRGSANKEIAQELFIEVGTVKWHITQIYRKLGVRSRMQAIVRAQELALVVEEGDDTDLLAVSSSIPSRTLVPEPENPYKGLRAFQTADAREFFGREELIDQLVKRMGEADSSARFLAVIGPSGSGKSSVVRAGLVPALWRGDLPGAERWFVVDMVPGPHPTDELEVALMRVAADQARNLHEPLTRDERGLLRVAQLILPDDGSELVVIVDQFEEVFTQVQDEASRLHFLNVLYAAVTSPRSRVRIVVTLRADFYDRPLHYPEFGELVRSRMETILPLSAEELQRAISKPAEQVGVAFEEGLVATIVAEINYQPGALPLLQYALTELFDSRENHCLTRQAYEHLGGAVGALAKRAEATYSEFDESGRAITRQMFLRLVSPGEGAGNTRRRVARAELLAVAADSDIMDEIIDMYTTYRLLSLDHDPLTRVPTVELAHEALLSEWERLRDWLDESRHDIRQQRLLAGAATEWFNNHQNSDYLLRGARLEQFARWAAESNVALTQDEHDFLDASITEEEQQMQSERERQAKELRLSRQAAEAAQKAERAQRRAANRLRYLVAGLAVFLLAAMALTLAAFNARDNAQRESAVSRSLVLAYNAQQALEAGNGDLALGLAVQAVDIDHPPPAAERILRTIAFSPGTRAVLEGHNNGVRAVAFSPDSQWALSGSCAEMDDDSTCRKGELILWDTMSGTEQGRLTGHTDWITSVAFTQNGDETPLLALSASSDGTLMLWDIKAGAMLRQLEGHSDAVNCVAASPDGRSALSGSEDGTLILWNLETGKAVRRFEGHTAAVNSVSFSPDGQTALSGSDDTSIIQWDVETGEELQRFEGHTDSVLTLAFSTDGTFLSGDNNSSLRQWNLETGDEIRSRHTWRAVNSLAITPDGRSALYGTWATTVPPLSLLDIEQWQTLQDFDDHASDVWAVAISPDGRFALSGYADGSLRLWQLQLGYRAFETTSEPLYDIAVSPDGHNLLTGNLLTDGATLWDVEQGREIRRFGAGEGMTIGVAFTPDGKRALVSYTDFGDPDQSSLILWDVETGAEIHRFGGQQCWIWPVDLSPDGRTAISGSYCGAEDRLGEGELALWELETGEMIWRTETSGDVGWVRFSPDGTRVLTNAVERDVVMLWDAATGTEIRRFPDFQAIQVWMDETTAIMKSNDTILNLVNVETGEITPHFESDEEFFTFRLSPDQRFLITGGMQGAVILWDVETGQEIRRFRGHTNIALATFSPDGQKAYSASYDGGLFEWEIGEWPHDELLAWIYDNRYIRDFTCKERAQYGIRPRCEASTD